MLNKKQLNLIKTDLDAWNNWRNAKPKAKVNLFGAKLIRAALAHINLSRADLTEANFTDSNLEYAEFNSAVLSDANLSKTNLWHTKFIRADLSGVDFSGAYLRSAKLTDTILTCADLTGAELGDADLTGATLQNIISVDADFSSTNLRCTDFSSAFLRNSNFRGANLDGADLSYACLSNVSLRYADLRGARLIGADLDGADLSYADFTGADLSGADLTGASLIETNLDETILNGCKIFGISAWKLRGVPKSQINLVITPDGEAEITVDDLQVAQFIYLLLNNQNVRNVIDTITSKAVLILGRFTSERKAVLDAIHAELRERNYLPIIFDFSGPQSRDVTETVSTLAHIARFVIADITDAKSIPQELQAIVPNLPSVPVKPILLSSQAEYGMFEHFKRYPWVLDTFYYNSCNELIGCVSENIINPLEAKVKELRLP